MNKDYKAKLLEKAGIYIDCCQLLKCVYKLLFSMPKKDRVIIGDKIIEYNLSMIAHFGSSSRNVGLQKLTRSFSTSTG